MPIIVKDNSKPMTPPPEGLHLAVCCDVVDLGEVETMYGIKEMVQLRWQIDVLNPETAHRFQVWNRYTASLNEKSNLYKHLQAWRGKKFTKAELAGFDLEKLVGANCQLQVVHNISERGTWANVQAIVPLGKGQPRIEVEEDYIREKDREDYKPPIKLRAEEEEAFTAAVTYDDEEGVPF